MSETAWQPMLPGLTIGVPATSGVSPLARAAQATIAALEAQGLLEDRHTLAVQLVLTLAESIDKNLTRDGKVTVAISQAMKQLQDALGALPVPVVDAGDPLGIWMDDRHALAARVLA